MFKNLKNKIQEETGQDPVTLPYRNMRTRHSMSSHNSLSIDELSKIEEVRKMIVMSFFHAVMNFVNAERCWDTKLAGWAGQLQVKNWSLRRWKKLARAFNQGWSGTERNILRWNRQDSECTAARNHEVEVDAFVSRAGLRSLNAFESWNLFQLLQESLDQMNKSKQDQDQIQSLKSEIARIKSIEQNFEQVQVSFSCIAAEKNLLSHRKVSFFWRFSHVIKWGKRKFFWWPFLFLFLCLIIFLCYELDFSSTFALRLLVCVISFTGAESL